MNISESGSDWVYSKPGVEIRLPFRDDAKAEELLSIHGEPNASTLEDRRRQLKEAATSHRWQVETGGVTTPNGIVIRTEASDQARITSVIANSANAGIETVKFKSANGWLTMTLEDVQGVAAIIALHVQACFSAECSHHEAIDAAADDDLENYDVTTGWPV